MRRTLFVSLLALTTMAIAWAPAAAQDATDLTGAWIVSSWTSADGEVEDDPERGLFVFGAREADGGTYSMMYVVGGGPRAQYEGEGLTDAEKLVAYDSFVANSGRFSIEGDQLIYEAYMAKDPNYQASWEENAVTTTWALDGDNLTLTWVDGFTPGASVTLRRPSGDN